MSPNTKSSQQQQQPQFYATKTELYLKVKKPLLERQRRARINKCLDTLKTLVAEFQGDDAIMRMDKAEMLESTIAFMRQHSSRGGRSTMPALTPLAPMDSFRNGYMNAVNEVSRVMAAMPGMSVDVGKSVMTHLGSEFNRLLQQQQQQQQQQQPRQQQQTIVEDVEEKLCEKLSRPSSRASSGYHSDCALDSPMPSPAPTAAVESANWRPWL